MTVLRETSKYRLESVYFGLTLTRKSDDRKALFQGDDSTLLRSQLLNERTEAYSDEWWDWLAGSYDRILTA